MYKFDYQGTYGFRFCSYFLTCNFSHCFVWLSVFKTFCLDYIKKGGKKVPKKKLGKSTYWISVCENKYFFSSKELKKQFIIKAKNIHIT